MMSSRKTDSQDPAIPSLSEPVSIYVHIPFCEKRCLYCDFVTEAGINHLIPDYLAALSRELEEVAEGFPATAHIHTIYLGGGTPSILPTEGVKALLDRIRNVFPVRANAEITLEMNPGTVNTDYLQDLKECGVNRLSIGMQSADNSELSTLGRIHNFEQCLNTFISSKEIGFENISADLIYGIPGQSLQSWGDSIQGLLDLEPSHASLYSLTIEDGTPYAKMVAEGVLTVPEDDLLADMYEKASEMLENNGFEQYEISNWAIEMADGSLNSSLHNLQYWRNLPYLGFGTGAHGCAEGIRMANITALQDYILRSANPGKNRYPMSFATADFKSIGIEEKMQETMMLGLRLTKEGVSKREFFARFGVEPSEVFGRQIVELVNQGLLEELEDERQTIRLTKRGRLLGNRVFMNFVGG